ncbi:hypothetical protein BGAL_0012g00090 [Botrytis galanthina]|uniref:Uncharacterized protein n=1 Tax=Botrytis galanthina TaxID=278940 RepID=A0A4S8RAY8_9HELO|nr:hypothetical protein BGAL_0012g00090 [Botrytis galanthina]
MLGMQNHPKLGYRRDYRRFWQYLDKSVRTSHSLSLSDNQKFPSIYAGAANRTVSYLEISYDFGLVKRDAGDVYIRIDYSNLEGYWNAVVNSAGESKKRSIDEISKRFFSPNATSWKSILEFDDVRSGASDALDHTLFATSFEGEDDNYASIGFSGNVSSKARFGYSFVGTIVPFNIVQAYGFSESEIEVIAMLDIQVYGGLKLPNTRANVFPSPVTSKEFSVPGLIHIKPSLQIVATLNANIEMAADFEVFFNTSTPIPITQYYPSSLGNANGSSEMHAMLLGDGFSDSTAGTARFGFMPTMQLDITIDSYSTGKVEIHETISAFHDAFVAINSDDKNCPSLQAGISGAQISLESVAGSFTPWSGDDTSQQMLSHPKSSDLPTICPRSLSGRSMISRDLPNDVINYPAPYVFGNYYLITCAVGLGAGDLFIGPQPGDPEFCSTSPEMFPYSGIFDIDGSELEYEDPEDIGPAPGIVGLGLRSVEERTAWRKFPAFAIGLTKTAVKSVSYPNWQRLLKYTAFVYRNYGQDFSKAATQCAVPILLNNLPRTAETVVEHVFEQQVLAKFIFTASGNIKKFPSGLIPTRAIIPTAAWDAFATIQVKSAITGEMGTMMHHLFSALGSYRYPGALSLVHRDLNALKGQLHRTNVLEFIGKEKWKTLNTSQQFKNLMRFMATYEYMNFPDNEAILQTVYLVLLEELVNWEKNLAMAEGISQWFIEFVDDFYKTMDLKARSFVMDKTPGIIQKAGGITRSAQIQEVAEAIQAQITGTLRSSWMDSIGQGPGVDLFLGQVPQAGST